MRAPRDDADVGALLASLDLPGLADIHTHFMPDRVMDKVWGYFDRQRRPDGTPVWPIAYRAGEQERIATLRALGLRVFTSLVYPHKPGMAAWLNTWAADFATRTPDCAHTATFFPEPEADGYVAEALEAGARVFKVHLQVGGYDPRDALLRPVWRRLERAAVPVVTHAGSGPEPGPFTGPEPISEVLAEHPGLVLVIAHMGVPEHEAFVEMALRHEHVHLDTTMVFTDFQERMWPFPRHLLERLAEHPERVVLGSDFPNIPHPYAHQLAALVDLGLGEEWLRAVLWRNGVRLLGLPALEQRPGAEAPGPTEPPAGP